MELAEDGKRAMLETLEPSLPSALAPLKAIILAAGKDATPDAGSLMLQPLGDHMVLDCVIENAVRVVPCEDIYVVVGSEGGEIQAHLGGKYHFVVQSQPLGTGNAVLQASATLKDFRGDLVILYGDTPLFRPDSIRGLINRHRLRKASLTLLTAVVDHPFPYGRIIRDAAGQIIDIIEDTEASPAVREILELNVGAYAVDAQAIFSALEKLPPSPLDGDYRLTDCVHQLIRSGLRVESYQLYDQDEVQGINTAADLARAEFILQKRLYRPRRLEERNLIVFGTGGWRAVIGDGSVKRWPTRSRVRDWKSAEWSSATIAGFFPNKPLRHPLRSLPATIFLRSC